MKEQELIITIGGRTNTGKSRLLYLLKKFLKDNDFDVEHIIDDDYKNEFDFNRSMIIEHDKVIDKIKSTRKIKIKEVHLPESKNNLTNISNIFKNCKLNNETILSKWSLGEISDGIAKELIRINNIKKVYLDDGNWFDMNTTTIYKSSFKNGFLAEYLLKTRKGNMIYKYCSNSTNIFNSFDYKCRIATPQDIELFNDEPVTLNNNDDEDV